MLNKHQIYKNPKKYFQIGDGSWATTRSYATTVVLLCLDTLVFDFVRYSMT